MEYTNGKSIISKLFKSALSIGTFIILLVTIPYIALFVIKALLAISIFGVFIWYSLKLVKGVKRFIYKISTKKDDTINDNISSFDTDTSGSIDINYDDSVVVDVDYEKVI